MGRLRSDSQSLQPAACLSRTASSPSASSDTNFCTVPWPPPLIVSKPTTETLFLSPTPTSIVDNSKKDSSKSSQYHNLDLQLSTTTSSNAPEATVAPKGDDNHHTQLQLSIGWASSDSNMICTKEDVGKSSSPRESNNGGEKHLAASRIIEQAREQFRLAMAERTYAENARQQAKMQLELAEQEFANAKRIRQKALAELDRAQALKDHAIKQVNSTLLEITCLACKQQFQARTPPDENSLVLSYVSSAITEGEVENDNRNDLTKSSKF
uniref:Uncharacterized protein n=1 Tax=Rhizophora mucronata TaxID=61149 RepID=A0A2P2NGQ5_RHIMU